MSAFHDLSRRMSFVLLLGLTSFCQAEEVPAWDDPPFAEFAEKLDTLLQKYYPKVEQGELPEDESTIRWAFDTRKFMVHIPSLRGEWQDATEMVGPKRKGILCEAKIHEGRYQGMAAIPQTFERFYFKVLLTAPYRKDVDAHVTVRLYYPPGVDPKFLTEFHQVIREFSAVKPSGK